MPDMAQDAVHMIYAPIHWLVVMLTGYGNG
jgi:hypothetical protein